jgi:hypothetical protein
MSQRENAGFNAPRLCVSAGDEVEGIPESESWAIAVSEPLKPVARVALLASSAIGVAQGDANVTCRLSAMLVSPLFCWHLSSALGVLHAANAAICDSGTPVSVGLGGREPRLWSWAVGVAHDASCVWVGRHVCCPGFGSDGTPRFSASFAAGVAQPASKA